MVIINGKRLTAHSTTRDNQNLLVEDYIDDKNTIQVELDHLDQKDYVSRKPSLSPRAHHMPQSSKKFEYYSSNSENYLETDQDFVHQPLEPVRYLKNRVIDDEDILDDREEEDIIQNLDHRAKCFGKFFRASFGSLSLCMAVISSILCLLRENFGFLPNFYVSFILHFGLIITYILCTYRSIKSKRNVIPRENSDSGDYYVEDIHRKIFWVNVFITLSTFIGWSFFALNEMDALSSLPWIRRLLVFFYAGMGPGMLFFTELSLSLMGNTLSEITSLWNHAQKYKSI